MLSEHAMPTFVTGSPIATQFYAPPPQRKSVRLGLTFPYDWSNSSIRDEALILKVLQYGIFEDVCRICAHFGLDAVLPYASRLQARGDAPPALERMLRNIEKGFARAQDRKPA